ncbi:MAG: hypothetical protein WC674_08320 [Candidatus Krumholzibacteriia bacterium]
MRSSSVPGRRVLAGMRAASTRCALSVAFLSLVFCTLCAPPPKPLPAPELSVTLEGEVALAGEGPLDWTVVLADAGGSVCALSSSRFEYELRSLAGHRVRVTGRVAGKTANGPEFLVESYELAPVGGRAPVAGTLVFRGAGLVLVESRSGVEYALAGPLAEVLRAFPGFKVWIDGPVTPFEKKNGGGGTIAVEGYGILAAPAGAILAPPEGGILVPPALPTPARP